jgi:hypothetical protein
LAQNRALFSRSKSLIFAFSNHSPLPLPSVLLWQHQPQQQQQQPLQQQLQQQPLLHPVAMVVAAAAMMICPPL